MTVAETDVEPGGLLERRFELSAGGSDLRTEILAGVATFLTMAYIVLVNRHAGVGFWCEPGGYSEQGADEL